MCIRDSYETKLNGTKISQEIVEQGNGVAILAINHDDEVIAVNEFRYPVGYVLEIPAGNVDKGETSLKCAQRELLEETGYKAGKTTFITEIHPCIGYSNERMWLYLAEYLQDSEATGDEDEFIELMPTCLDDAMAMVQSGEITDVKAVIGLFWAEKVLRGQWKPSQAKKV
mgnify:CR=1 FL=1